MPDGETVKIVLDNASIGDAVYDSLVNGSEKIKLAVKPVDKDDEAGSEKYLTEDQREVLLDDPSVRGI